MHSKLRNQHFSLCKCPWICINICTFRWICSQDNPENCPVFNSSFACCYCALSLEYFHYWNLDIPMMKHMSSPKHQLWPRGDRWAGNSLLKMHGNVFFCLFFPSGKPQFNLRCSYISSMIDEHKYSGWKVKGKMLNGNLLLKSLHIFIISWRLLIVTCNIPSW